MFLTTQRIYLCKRNGYSITPEYGDIYDINLLVETIGKKAIPTSRELIKYLHNKGISAKVIKGVLFFENKIDAAEAIRVISNI